MTVIIVCQPGRHILLLINAPYNLNKLMDKIPKIIFFSNKAGALCYTPTKYHLLTNEFLQEKGIYTKKLHHQTVQKLLSKKIQRSGFMSFKKFTGVQKGQKLGLDSLLLNFESLMWIFEW